jgi:hypothetical protein
VRDAHGGEIIFPQVKQWANKAQPHLPDEDSRRPANCRPPS